MKRPAYFGNILNWVTFIESCLKARTGYCYTATIVSHT